MNEVRVKQFRHCDRRKSGEEAMIPQILPGSRQYTVKWVIDC